MAVAPLALALLVSPEPTQHHQGVAGGTVFVLDVRSRGEVLDGHGASASFTWRSPSDGTVFLWAESDELDPFLRVEDEAGLMVAQDENSGGGTIPVLDTHAHSGGALRILVSGAAGETGSVLVHLHLSAESDATIQAMLEAQEIFSEADRAMARRDFDAALQAARAVLDTVEAVPGFDDSFALTSVTARAGLVAQELGDWDLARRALQHVLQRRERWFPPAFPELIAIHTTLGLIEYEAGNYEAALAHASTSVQRMSAVRDPDDTYLLGERFNASRALKELGRADEALAIQEDILARLERMPAPDPSVLRLVRTGYAQLLSDAGRFLEARVIQEDLVASFESAPRDDVDRQLARYNLATTLYALGDHPGALALRRECEEVLSRVLPPDDPYVQLARIALAASLNVFGELEQALALERAALESSIRTLGEDHPDVQGMRLNTAQTLVDLGRPGEARELLETVLDAFESRGQADHDIHRLALATLAGTYEEELDWETALDLRLRVLERHAARIPEDDPELIGVRALAVRALLVVGDLERARRLGLENATAALRILRGAELVWAPRELERLTADLDIVCDHLIALTLATPPGDEHDFLARTSFETVEAMRGAVLRGAALLRAVEGDARAVELRGRAQQASAEVSALVGEGASLERVYAAVQRRDAAQRDLLAGLGGGAQPGSHVPLPEPTAEALATRLRGDEALVAWRAWSRNDDRTWTASLVAFVLRPERGPVLVDLGELEPVAGLVRDFRDSCIQGSALPRGEPVERGAQGSPSAGLGLRRAILEPLLPELEGARRLVLVPDDALHLVPFGVLPAVASGVADPPDMLGEQWSLSVRSTAWELLAEASRTGDARPLLVGAIDYDGASPVANPVVALAGDARFADRSGFAELPASRGEVEGIAALARASGRGEPRLLTGAEATRDRFAELARGADVLHLATHGWFESTAGDRGATDLPGRSSFSPQQADATLLSPMALSGLALAGANRRDADGRRTIDERGTITAEELAQVDLSACDLAVLSACETSIGVRRAGQGVASLQSSLHQAGARSVITSLWRVPDAATRDLMVDFYRRLWIDGKPKARALWEAQMELFRARDAAGQPLYSTGDWAGWVLTGDPD